MGLIICEKKEEVLMNFIIRRDVFMLEQNVTSEEEFDLEEVKGDMFLYQNDDGIYASCARVIYESNKAHIGRVATLKEYRHMGYASKMLEEIEKYLKTLGINECYLGAQVRVKSFYENLGYECYGEEFLDARIPHINMKKKIK